MCVGVGMNVGVTVLTCMLDFFLSVRFFLLVRLLYWCAFCTRNLCFSLRAHRFSLVSLWLHIAFHYLWVRVFCGVLVRVTIVVRVCMA